QPLSPAEIYPLSLHDALPIFQDVADGEQHGLDRADDPPATLADDDDRGALGLEQAPHVAVVDSGADLVGQGVDEVVLGLVVEARSEEHTSELQSRGNLVCRLL